MPSGVYILKNRGKWNIGKVRSKEFRKNVGNFWRGKKKSEDLKRKDSEAHRGAKHYNFGKKQSPEWIAMIKSANSGSKSHLWKGGITPLFRSVRKCFKYRQWRSDIFTRDNWTCVDCNIRGGVLKAHHLKTFAAILWEYKIKTLEEALLCEELWDINNGVTLCHKCHWDRHRKMKYE